MPIADQKITEQYALYNADTMEVLPSIADGSVDFSIYSPPFPELYQYSNDPRDMSNCATYEEGIAQYQFIVDQIFRVTKPGRLSCVHCMDLKSGQRWQRDFPGDIVRAHEAAGFHWAARITIWKDPWLIARRTRMRSLMHKTIVNDSARAHPAGPDYVLVFEKGGENAVPITHQHGFKRYFGSTPMPADLVERFSNFTGDQRKNLLSHWIWRQYASPVWMDIRTGRLLPYKDARETDEEKHVCPLQLDVIERCLEMWSNVGDVVLSPFHGVGSEVCAAIVNGRRAIGSELKSTYYRQSLQNMETVSKEGWGRQEDELPFGETLTADDSMEVT